MDPKKLHVLSWYAKNPDWPVSINRLHRWHKEGLLKFYRVPTTDHTALFHVYEDELVDLLFTTTDTAA